MIGVIVGLGETTILLPRYPAMNVEHIALQVKDPVAVVEWYGKHLGFRVVRNVGGPAQTFFLADSAGHVVLEVYSNPTVPVPDYASMHPLLLHVAFQADDVAACEKRLLMAGATSFSGVETLPSGDVLAMLRDPFGLAIQLACRKHTLLAELPR